MTMVSDGYDRLFGAGAPRGDSFGCNEGVYCAKCCFADECDIVCDLSEGWHEAWKQYKEDEEAKENQNGLDANKRLLARVERAERDIKTLQIKLAKLVETFVL